MPAASGASPAAAAEGREWWVQLQQQRRGVGLQGKSPCAGLPHYTPSELQDALLHANAMSPELAADLGLDWVPELAQGQAVEDREQQRGSGEGPPSPQQQPPQQQLEEEDGDEDVEDVRSNLLEAPQEQLQPRQRRKSSLAKASQALLHRMAQHKPPEQDVMSQIAAAAEAEANMARPALQRTASDAQHLESVLSSGSEIMARAEQASSAWQSMQSRGPLRPQHMRAPGTGLTTIAEGMGVGGVSARGGARATGDPGSPRRGQRKSILGQPGLTASSSNLSLGGGAATVGARASSTSSGGAKRASVALPQAGGASSEAARRWEEEQEAELAEVLRAGAFGDPEIQEYLVRELSRTRRKRALARAGGAGAAGGGGEGAAQQQEPEDDGRLDPIVQAWLVTKVPAPRVEGYMPPPSRTACRLIAAQEMQKYYLHQKRHTGTFFKWLGLSLEQAGNREQSGKFVVGTDEKAPEAQRKTTLRGLVRKSLVTGTLNQMVKGAQATVWAREHVELITEVAAREVARQRAIRSWQVAFDKVKALAPEEIAAWGPLEPPGNACSSGGSSAGNAGDAVQGGPVAGGGSSEMAAQEEGASQAGAAGGGPVAEEQAQLRQSVGGGAKGGSRQSAGGNWSRVSSHLGRLGAGEDGGAAGGGMRASGAGASAASSSSLQGDRRESEAASQADRGRAGGAGPAGLPPVGAGRPGKEQLNDLASVAAAALAQHKQRLTKLPKLHLERLAKGWEQQAARQLNTERARQGQKAREQLRDRWQQLQQRRAAVAD